MREHSFLVVEPLVQGLRPDSRAARGKSHLVECTNAVVREGGLRSYEGLTSPFSAATLAGASVTIAHPFPQLFKGSGVTLLADETAIFTVDESTWSLTAITTYDAYSTATPKAITAGSSWHFAEVHGTWYLFNGQCFVYKLGGNTKTLVDDTVTANTGCVAAGSLVLGGLSASNFWSSTWETWWQGRVTSEDPPNSNLDLDMEAAQNFVWWSSVGGGDLEFIQSYTYGTAGRYAIADAHDATNFPLIMDYMMRNEQGWMPMPWQGEVLCTKPLGKGFVAYGEDGISYMDHYAAPTRTFAPKLTLPFGVANRSAVAGDIGRHLFMDEAGDVWALTADGEITKRGFKEFTTTLYAEDVVGVFDPTEGDVYFSDNDECLVITAQGASFGPQLPTSGYRTSSDFYGIYGDSSTAYGQIITDAIDMDSRALKHITSVEIAGSLDTAITVAIDYKYTASDSWARTGFVGLNNEGFATHHVSGVEFRIVVKVAAYATFDLDYMRVRYQTDDNRYRRGTEASSYKES